MIIEKKPKFNIYHAEKGKVITTVIPSDTYLKMLILGKGDYIENYKEIYMPENMDPDTLELLPTKQEIREALDILKDTQIYKSKENLATYLVNNPLKSNCHNNTEAYYTVTQEKQSQFTSKFTAHQVKISAGLQSTMTWNAQGQECEIWTDAECLQFIVELDAYVTPLVKRQQLMEKRIRECTTKDEVMDVDITFIDGVQYV